MFVRVLRPCRAAAAVTALAVAGSCAPSPNAPPTPARGGTVVLGSISDVDSWNEYTSRQAFANNVLRRVFLRLATESPETAGRPPDFVPQLAESWSFSEDGRTLTFRLADATWSDGRPVTASDVRFTWTAQASPDVAWINADTKKRITGVEIVDPRTVAFRFDRRYPEQLADAVEGGILPEHVYAQIPFRDWLTHDWSQSSVGSGPFILESHRRGEEFVLARNPRYGRKGLPLLDRVVVRVVPDATSLLTQLLAGQVDWFEGVPPREAERVRSAKGMRLIAFDYPMYDYVGWNEARPPLDDPDVRRALTLAIDRKSLVEDLLYGYGRIATGPVLSFSWGVDSALRPWPYDPAEARRILASKGFTARPGDGVLERGGKAFEIALTTNAGNRLREAVTVKMQEQLSRIGVVARPTSLEMQTFVQKNTEGDFDAYVGGWRLSGKVDLRSLFASDAVPPGGKNVVRYRSAELDRILDTVDRAEDWAAMRAALAAAQRTIHSDQPYTFLYETRRLAAVGPRLHGVEIEVPLDPLAGLERWWVSP